MMTLRFTSALLLAAFAVLPSVTQSHPLKDTGAAREQQWLFREALGEGTQMPTAVFLSWDYSSVILTATCDLKSSELVVRNPLQADDKLPELFTIKIASQAGIVSLRTVRHDRVLEGRTKITRDVVAVLHYMLGRLSLYGDWFRCAVERPLSITKLPNRTFRTRQHCGR
jgi:hypothetical protein